MRLFHITGNENVEAILKDGFRDNTSYFRSDLVEIQDGFGNYRPDAEYTGVWVSDEPDMEYLHGANTTLVLEIPAGVLSDFQWFEEGELYRKWLIPAAILNSYGPPTVGDHKEWVEDYDEMESFAREWEKDHPEVLDPPSNDWIDKPADWIDK